MATPDVSCPALLVGDFNGDGTPDIACYGDGENGDEFSLLPGKGDGTFQQPLMNNIPGSADAAGDFNGDGRLDIVTSGWGEGQNISNMSVALGKGDGSFLLDTIIGTGGYGFADGSILIADLNGDGKPDLINDGGDYVGIFLGNGNGTFQKQIAFGLRGGGDQRTSSNAAAADFNHDGKLDLAVVDSGYVGVLLGNGDGTFQPEVQYAVTCIYVGRE